MRHVDPFFYAALIAFLCCLWASFWFNEEQNERHTGDELGLNDNDLHDFFS